jgi:hypothetical protein
MDKLNIIDRPLGELGLSAGFLERCRQMGFTSLRQIITCGAKGLMERPGFNYHWLSELTAFLTQHQLLHLIQPQPGK